MIAKTPIPPIPPSPAREEADPRTSELIGLWIGDLVGKYTALTAKVEAHATALCKLGVKLQLIKIHI